jgi:hypothetical protein
LTPAGLVGEMIGDAYIQKSPVTGIQRGATTMQEAMLDPEP